MRAALVLRPEPGNAATAARLTAAGVAVRRCPLFAVAPVAWTPPSPGAHDALLLTSANAVRQAGPGLAALAALPVLAVGQATATAATTAGLTIAWTGDEDAAALGTALRAGGWHRPLHLAGRERHLLPGVAAITVYASETLPIPMGEVACWANHLALLHSARAARRFARLVDAAGLDRAWLAVAALSPAVAAAAGSGWRAVTVADRRTDAALVASAAALIDPARPAADKRA